MEQFLAASPVACISQSSSRLPSSRFLKIDILGLGPMGLIERHSRSSHVGLNIRSKKTTMPICMVLAHEHQAEDTKDGETESPDLNSPSVSSVEFSTNLAAAVEKDRAENESQMLKRIESRKSQRYTYLFAAVASTLGITTLAAGAVYYRFYWQMQGTSEVPWTEIFGTFSLAVGAAVGMEFWARWAHRVLWHASLWSMHESHHRPREGPFELNDVFAIVNAVPAIALMAFGIFHKGLVPGLCFGAGLGITMFGMAYMFVHDGLVHRRFPVGPIANVPYLQKVAAAHQLHHADLFKGVPYGLFLGPKELEDVQGLEELEKLMRMRKKALKENEDSEVTA